MIFDEIETYKQFKQLEPARTWADANIEQCGEALSLVMFQNEHSLPTLDDTWRDYDVCELRTFLSFMIDQGTLPVHRNEVLPANTVCKTYMDLDFKEFDEPSKYGAADVAELRTMLDAMLQRLIAFVLDRLSARCGRRLSADNDVVVLTAHKKTKWSCHVIVDSAYDESIVWRSTEHCGNFVLDCVEQLNEPLASVAIDAGVYSRNHCMRTYYSSKVLESLRVLRTPAEHSSGSTRFSERTMLRSLVSCVRIRHDRWTPPLLHHHPLGDETLLRVSSLLIAKRPPTSPDWAPLEENGVASGRAVMRRAPHTESRRQHVISSDLVCAICEHDEFERYKPAKAFKSGQTIGQFLLPCSGRYCVWRSGEGSEHGDHHSPVYLIIDAFNRRWTQRCKSAECEAVQEWAWQQMPDELGELCTRYLKDEYSECRPMAGLRQCLFGYVPESRSESQSDDDDTDDKRKESDNDEEEALF